MQVNCFNRVATLAVAPVLISGLMAGSAFGSSITTYTVEMDRINPNKPIRKSAIMSTVREKFPGRILSIRENRNGGPDCHIVKSMGQDGEFRIIHVACEEE